jgi:hypothetical protein
MNTLFLLLPRGGEPPARRGVFGRNAVLHFLGRQSRPRFGSSAASRFRLLRPELLDPPARIPLERRTRQTPSSKGTPLSPASPTSPTRATAESHLW